MKTTLLPLLTLMAVGCAPKGSFDGKLVDPLTGMARGEEVIFANAPGVPNLNCQKFQTTTAADGTFRFDGLCAAANYTIVAEDKTLIVIKGGVDIAGGVPATEQVNVEAWRSPTGQGVFILENDTLKAQKAGTEVGMATLWETEDTVLYPATLPTRVPLVDSGQYLVMAGARYATNMELLPLTHSDRRRFGSRAYPEPSEPWWYIGIDFKSDTEYTRTTADPAAGKAFDIKVGDNPVRFIAGDALPNGFYTLMNKRDQKMYIFNFGPELKAPGAE